MGLLDDFKGFIQTPEGQGLLSAAFGGLAGAKPGQPWNTIGRAGLAGLLGYQNAQDQQQQQALQNLQVKTLGLENEAKQTALDRQKRVSDVLRPGGQAPSWMQNVSLPAGGPAQSRTAPAGNNSHGRYLQIAQNLEQNGLFDEAQKYYDLADKFRPKIKDQRTLMQDGRPVNVITYEDGRQEVSQYGAMPENQIIDLGGRQVVIDKNTASNGQSFDKTMTPGEVASNRLGVANYNLALDRRNAERSAPKGQIVQTENGPILVDPRTGAGQQITVNGQAVPSKESQQRRSDATSVLSILDEAEPLLDKANGGYIGAGLTAVAGGMGIGTDAVKANAQLKALEGLLISKMPKMSGPQSDKDVLLYRQMAGQIGDPTVPTAAKKAALQIVRQINEKYLADNGGSGSTPTAGAVMDGYRFKGGNPADPNAWEKI